MAGITLVIAEQHLAESLAAASKIRLGQSVDMDGRKLTRADLADVQKGIVYWNSQVARLSRNGLMRIVEAIPR